MSGAIKAYDSRLHKSNQGPWVHPRVWESKGEVVWRCHGPRCFTLQRASPPKGDYKVWYLPAELLHALNSMPPLGDRCTIFHDIGGENDWIIVKIRNMYSVSDRGCWQIGVKILPVDEAENLTGFPIMTKEVENENGSSAWVKCTTIWAKMPVLVMMGWS